jgi:energy-coupling factor transporter ATP-binding protein EcfA2
MGMALALRRVTAPPLVDFDAAAPDGAIIGIIGENGSGQEQLFRIAAGKEKPRSGMVETPRAAVLLGPDAAPELPDARLLLLDHTLARLDALERERASIALQRMRAAGSTILLASHEEDLLRRVCDEIWWIHNGKLAGRGDPSDMLAGYRQHISARVRAWGESVHPPLHPRMRRGDGRAEVLRIDTIGENGCPTMVWRSGELALVRVVVRFRDAVADPVIGILIRTRIGLNVYGTNTELERLKLGPCSTGEVLEVQFGFRCELCPQEYTLTAASHDPDGVWHDWMEDAVAFSVTDNRYTAGVANLRATASFKRLGS